MEQFSILKRAKLLVLNATDKVGVSHLILNSEWRRRRLLILCYHAASPDDEYQCFPGFYMPVEMFRQRLQYVSDMGVRVLPLEEAVERMYDGTLPHRSAVITLDDGFYAAWKHCRPLLNEFGFPYTVYMTTYYVEYNRPVFDPMCRYLLWKATMRELDWPELLPAPVRLDAGGRTVAESAIRQFSQRKNLSGSEKDALLGELAGRLQMDYARYCRERILHLVNPDEAKLWAREADLQLHTHRHRVSRRKEVMYAQIRENSTCLERMIGGTQRHLAYPGGACIPQFSKWLTELGLRSAVTCQTGLASPASDRMLLPRVMETTHVRTSELSGWITGISALLPVRRIGDSPDIGEQFLDPA